MEVEAGALLAVEADLERLGRAVARQHRDPEVPFDQLAAPVRQRFRHVHDQLRRMEVDAPRGDGLEEEVDPAAVADEQVGLLAFSDARDLLDRLRTETKCRRGSAPAAACCRDRRRSPFERRGLVADVELLRPERAAGAVDHRRALALSERDVAEQRAPVVEDPSGVPVEPLVMNGSAPRAGRDSATKRCGCRRTSSRSRSGSRSRSAAPRISRGSIPRGEQLAVVGHGLRRVRDDPADAPVAQPLQLSRGRNGTLRCRAFAAITALP